MVEELLNQLYELQQHMIVVKKEWKEEQNALFMPDIRKWLEQTDTYYSGHLAQLENQAKELETAIKQSVLEQGKGVKSDHLQAVFSKGRCSWNDDALCGFGAAHPEIMQWRSVGKPSVAIREVKHES